MVQISIKAMDRDELREMSMEQQLGYLQSLAGLVYLDERLPEKDREDALTMEEVGVHFYRNIATGRCSLAVTLATDLDELENKIIDDIMYYQELLA
jgi:hypothetical protein